MSAIGRMLEAKEPLFKYTVEQLEKRTGHKGIDIKLTAEIASKAANRTQRLGISEHDTAQGLYQALIGRVKQDDARLCRLVGGNDPTDLDGLVPLIIEKLNEHDLPRSGWFIKEDFAKQMLIDTPPPGIMELLGYKDAQALVDKEDIFKLFCALRFCEDADWLNEFNNQYAPKLTPAAFENRDIKIVIFEHERWGKVTAHFIKKKLHNITHSKEMGAICVLPAKDVHTPGVTTKIMPLLAHYFNEVRMYSSFFKLLKARSDFGKVVADTLVADVPKVKIDTTGEVEWRVIQRYYGKLKDEYHPEIFEPHLQPEDLHWRRAEEILYEVDPELEFWKDMDYVGVFRGDDLVTFNLMDISLSYANELKFEDRYLYHFREALWNEVFARYFGEKVMEDLLLKQLNNQLIDTDKI